MNKKSENISEDIGDNMKRRVTMKLFKTQSELLQKTIRENFGIVCTIQHHKEKYLLYFPVNQLPLLSTIVKPHMIPCMYYKLNGY